MRPVSRLTFQAEMLVPPRRSVTPLPYQERPCELRQTNFQSREYYDSSARRSNLKISVASLARAEAVDAFLAPVLKSGMFKPLVLYWKVKLNRRDE